jgi:hypothetical protein
MVKITYERFIDHLRSTPPVLENPNELAQGITARIERIAEGRAKRISLRITGLLSGAAACLLLCLLVYDAVRLPAYRNAGTQTTAQLPAGRIALDVPEAARATNVGNVGNVELRKAEIAGIVKERLERRNRKQQIYSAYLCKLVNSPKHH